MAQDEWAEGVDERQVEILRGVVERARAAMDARDAQGITDAIEALQRTLNMFKGVVAKTQVG